ncbi:MAG: pyridoxamine 5'-phosphate oxidase family protein [Bacteroidales bacterium]|nr:MAG: pyridoxamine 5'-phosphate oxidase family protein [Bacteroidales bacterium]
MRKKEYQITDFREIEKIIKSSLICRLGLCNDNVPYVVPLNFGYKDKVLYFHSAAEGKKIEYIRKNNNVCFEIEGPVQIIEAENACNWATKYSSIIGWGIVNFVSDPREKKIALDIIMKHHSKKTAWKYNETSVKKVCIFKVIINKVDGKKVV